MDEAFYLLAMTTVRKTPSLAERRRRQVKAWKEQYRLYTHKGPDDWMSLSMNECCELLKGYSLTDAQKTDGAELMAGYCRLIDEAGLVHFGETEHEACQALVKRFHEATA